MVYTAKRIEFKDDGELTWFRDGQKVRLATVFVQDCNSAAAARLSTRSAADPRAQHHLCGSTIALHVGCSNLSPDAILHPPETQQDPCHAMSHIQRQDKPQPLAGQQDPLPRP